MYLLINGIYTLAYLAVAVIVGFSVHRGGFIADPTAAIAIGVSVLLLGVLLHSGVSRARRDRMMVTSIATVKRAQIKIEKEAASSRKDINALATATERAMQASVPGNYDNIVAEVRTLETLVHQISGQPETQEASPFKLAIDAVSAPMVADDIDGEKLPGIIRDAINENRVDIYLQPVVGLPQRKPIYYETFSRLRGADGTLLEPSKYIGVAESTGLITAIDNNLLFRCVQLVRKSQRRRLNFSFFCNISHFTLKDTSFFPEFIEFMQQNTGLAENLIFEFAHSDLATHDRYITRNLGQLGELGFRFSVDRVQDIDLDVEELVTRGVSFIKIGATVTLKALGDSDESLQFYRVKHALERAGIQLIVEKIEEEEQLVDLLDYGIDFGQGYLFGTPRLSREI